MQSYMRIFGVIKPGINFFIILDICLASQIIPSTTFPTIDHIRSAHNHFLVASNTFLYFIPTISFRLPTSSDLHRRPVPGSRNEMGRLTWLRASLSSYVSDDRPCWDISFDNEWMRSPDSYPQLFIDANYWIYIIHAHASKTAWSLCTWNETNQAIPQVGRHTYQSVYV